MKSQSAIPQESRISVNMKNSSIEDILKIIEQKSNYHFLYNNQLVNVDKKKNIDVQNTSISNILSQLFRNENIEYKIVGNQIILTPKNLNSNTQTATGSQQQPPTKLVSGKVTDENGELLPGATILIKGTNRGGVTDIDGGFSLMLSSDEKTLVVSFVGMETQEISIDNRSIYNIALQPVTGLLDEVIVTGYQTISKERATGSFAVVSPNSLQEKLQTNILSRLEGQVAGLVPVNGELSLRGLSTLRGKTESAFGCRRNAV